MPTSPTLGTAYIKIAPDMTGVQSKVAAPFKGVGQDVAKQMSGGISAGSAAIVGAIGGIAAAATTKVIGLVTSSVGEAITLVDTLNNSNRTFKNMGIDGKVAADAMAQLRKDIKPLPTDFGAATRSVTALTATYGDINKGVDIFNALNNGILGFGGTADQVNNAIMQISQLPMDGPLDAQTWNSLRNSGLTPVLTAIAKQMGMSVSELKSNLGDGTLKVKDFMDQIVELDKNGGGGLESLRQIALDSTTGINTGFDNMKQNIAEAMANIINRIGSANISAAIGSIGEAISGGLNFVVTAINFVADHADLFGTLAVGIGAAAAAMALYNIAVTTAATVQAIFNAVMALNPISVIVLAVIALTAALIYFFTQTEAGQKIWADFSEFVGNAIKWVGDKISAIVDWIKNNWPLLLAILTGPFGIAVALIIKNFDTIKAFATGLINSIRDTFNGIVQIGKDFVEGLWNGINSKVEWIKSKIKGFGEAVLNGIKSFFGIQSPSKVMRDQVGKMIGQGIAEGITGSTEDAINAATNASQDILDTFTGSTPQAGAAPGNGGITVNGDIVLPNVAKPDDFARELRLATIGRS